MFLLHDAILVAGDGCFIFAEASVFADESHPRHHTSVQSFCFVISQRTNEGVFVVVDVLVGGFCLFSDEIDDRRKVQIPVDLSILYKHGTSIAILKTLFCRDSNLASSF